MKFKFCKFTDVPDAPVITQIDCNERKAMVKWRRPDDRGDKIKKFLVQMQTEFEEVWFVQNKVSFSTYFPMKIIF